MIPLDDRHALRTALLTAMVLTLGVLLGTPAATAQSVDGLEPSVAVLELYVEGQPYPKTPEYVSRLAAELDETGAFSMLDREDAERQVRKVMTASSRRVTDAKLKEIERLIKEGDELIYVKPREAIDRLNQAKIELKMVMESLSLNEKVREDYFRTQMSLARAHRDNDNEQKASEILEEIIRTFGDDFQVTDDNYHPDIVRLYREAYRRLDKQRNGRLKVTVAEPGAEVLINGKVQDSKAPYTFEGLFPGTITVSARKDGRESMIRKVVVKAGDAETAEVHFDIDYETSMAFNEGRFGFEFRDQTVVKARVADFAARIGAMLSVDFVCIAGLVEADGRTYLEGYLVNVKDGTVERELSLYTKGNVVSKNRVVQMARALAGKPAGDIAELPDDNGGSWTENYAAWGVLGGGILVAGLSAVPLIMYADAAEQGGCNPNIPGVICEITDNAERQAIAEEGETFGIIGGVMLGVGAAAIVGSIIMFAVMDIEPDAGVALGPDLKLHMVTPSLVAGRAPGVGAVFSF